MYWFWFFILLKFTLHEFTIYIMFIDDEIYCLNVELMTCEIVIRFLFSLRFKDDVMEDIEVE